MAHEAMGASVDFDTSDRLGPSVLGEARGCGEGRRRRALQRRIRQRERKRRTLKEVLGAADQADGKEKENVDDCGAGKAHRFLVRLVLRQEQPQAVLAERIKSGSGAASAGAS